MSNSCVFSWTVSLLLVLSYMIFLGIFYYHPLFYYYPIVVCFIIIRVDRVDSDRKKDVQELEVGEGGETLFCIYCIKNIFQ